MTLVMGVDSSTQSCKVLVRDIDTGEIVRQKTTAHPPGTEVDPELWWDALVLAIEGAGGFEGVSAVSIAGQQHGLVLLDSQGRVLRPALLWNDTRSAAEADELIAHFGAEQLARRTGSKPVASITATKLLWVAKNEPGIAADVAAVCLPHDYLSWRLSAGFPDINTLFTDRSDASGTGYFDPVSGDYDDDILRYCLGRVPVLPRVLDDAEVGGMVSPTIASDQVVIGPGMGDNASAARGLGLAEGDFAVSLGTSGTVFGVSGHPSADPRGYISGFASGDGKYLPLVCTLNAARVITWGASLLGVDVEEFSELALQAPPGAAGLHFTPYLEGERTPNLPDATASLEGITLANGSRENFARACIEGMLRGLVDAGSVLRESGHVIERLLVIGGAAASPAVQHIAREMFDVPVEIPPNAEYVAQGACVQAAEVWRAHSGSRS